MGGGSAQVNAHYAITPFDGIVAEMLCAPGDVVSVSAPIMHAREAGEAPDTQPPKRATGGAHATTGDLVRTPRGSAGPATAATADGRFGHPRQLRGEPAQP